MHRPIVRRLDVKYRLVLYVAYHYYCGCIIIIIIAIFDALVKVPKLT